MLFERCLARERRTVDALQHRVALVAAPVGAGHAGELDGRELAGAGDVRPLAEVDPLASRFAVAVERQLFTLGGSLDDLDLVGLAHLREQLERALRSTTSRRNGEFFLMISSIFSRSSPGLLR